MTLATRLYSTLPYLECQSNGGSSSVKMGFSPYCTQAVVRTARGYIW
jgi:hypothetical protein